VRSNRRRHYEPTPSVAEPRPVLLAAVRDFVREAAACAGVLRVALVGSLTTEKAVPKDADVLVIIDGGMELNKLARAGGRLKGRAQRRACCRASTPTAAVTTFIRRTRMARSTRTA